MLPFFSIITVSFNARETIEETIKSVLNQGDDFEYIIIDGGSTDGTLEIIERHKDKIAFFVSEKDNGLYDAMNKGIKRARGEWIGILNADDTYTQNALKEIQSAIRSNQNAQIIHGGIEIKYKHKKRLYLPKEKIKKTFFMPVWHPTVFVKRDVYENIGLFDIHYKLSADYEFITRCISNNISFANTKEIITQMKYGGRSVSNFKEGLKETYHIAQKYKVNNSVILFLDYCWVFILATRRHIINKILG